MKKDAKEQHHHSEQDTTTSVDGQAQTQSAAAAQQVSALLRQHAEQQFAQELEELTGASALLTGASRPGPCAPTCSADV
jgi:hypothetical protein